MDPPNTLLGLELTLRTEHDLVRQGHIAHLAGRLGYRVVWLPVDAAQDSASPAALETLARSAQPARLGIVPFGAIGAVREWLPAAGDVLIELAEVDGEVRAGLIGAVGGRGEWRDRVRTAALDLESAGHVVHAESRDAALAAVAHACQARVEAGRGPADYPIVVAMPVAIGRTMNEAEARALRDPALAIAGEPRHSGLFGGLDDAQAQALALADAGADAVRATLADEADVADLLAQLRSVAVGPSGRHVAR